MVLDVRSGRGAPHPGLCGVRPAGPPAGADLSVLPEPVDGTEGGERPRDGGRVHRQRSAVAARLRTPLRGRQRGAGRGPDRPSHDQRRRLPARGGAHRARGRGAFRARGGRVGAAVRADRCDRPGRPGARAGASGPARPARPRAVRAPGGAVGDRPVGPRAAADGRPAVADGRRVPRGGGRRGTGARGHRRAVDLSGRGRCRNGDQRRGGHRGRRGAPTAPDVDQRRWRPSRSGWRG